MSALQWSLFPPESTWRPPRLSELPQDWRVFSRIGLDTETRDEQLRQLGPGVRRGGYVTGVSLAFPEAGAFYLPLAHEGGDNVEDVAAAWRYLSDNAARYAGEVVGARLGYDLDFLAEAGVNFPLAVFRDVTVAEPLLDELQYTYGLDAILGRHGLPGKDEGLLREAAEAFKINGKPLDPKRDMWRLPARFVGGYAEADAFLPLRLLEKQEEIIERDDLRRVWDMESAVLPVLVRMRRRGVRVNLDKLDAIDRFARAEEQKAWAETHRLTGVSVKVGDAMKAEVLAGVFRAVDIEPGRTKTGKVSIDKAWLDSLKHPVAACIRRARKMSQLRTTFVNAIREHQVNGRIHCTFNQTVSENDQGESEGAAFGRTSCQDPNLQQAPARDPEIGPMYRAVYEPEPEAKWGCLDYSTQEPRLTLHFAVLSGREFIGPAHESALSAAKQYWEDRNTDPHGVFTRQVFGDSVADDPKVYKLKRDQCKQIFLGIVYGMGGSKLCRSLGLPTTFQVDDRTGFRREVAGPEGQSLLAKVDQRAPYLRKTAQAVERVAKQRGFVKTILGRRCHFPRDAAGNFEWTHKALNRIVQGSAADQTKMAMVEMDRAGACLHIQVHDECDISIRDVEEGRQYAQIMEECLPLKVPSRVDLEVGPSWGEIA